MEGVRQESGGSLAGVRQGEGLLSPPTIPGGEESGNTIIQPNSLPFLALPVSIYPNLPSRKR